MEVPAAAALGEAAESRHARIGFRYGVANCALLLIVLINAIARLHPPSWLASILGLALLWCPLVGVGRGVAGLLEIRKNPGLGGKGKAVFAVAAGGMPLLLFLVGMVTVFLIMKSRY